MKLINLYSEHHGDDIELTIVRDPHTNKTYSIYYKNNINVVFESVDELYRFNYVYAGVKRAYIDERELESLYDRIDRPFESYLEWMVK